MGNRHEDDLHPCAWRQPACRTSQSLAQTPNHSVRDTVQGRRRITVLETLHGVRDTWLLRPVWSRYVRPVSLLKRPANRPTSQRLHPSTVSRRHTTMSETSRVRRHPTMSETRIWPGGSRPVFGSLLSRGRLASFRVWRWLSPVWCFRRSCRSFGSFPRGLFLVVAFSVSPRLLSGSSFLCRK